MHYQCSLAAAVGSRCTGVRSGVATGRGSRGIGAAQKVIGPSMGVKHKEMGADGDRMGTATHAAPYRCPRVVPCMAGAWPMFPQTGPSIWESKFAAVGRCVAPDQKKSDTPNEAAEARNPP